MKNKKIFFISIITIILILLIIVIVFLIHSNSISVHVIPLSKDISGGSTRYEVTGTSSFIEANKAIIKEYYKGDSYFRTITDSEIQNIADQIAIGGCGQIVSSWVGAPPVDDARNWVNFKDNNNDYIDVYMLGDKYLVQTQCQD